MNKIRYADAGMDVRKLLLRFLQKIWIVVAATVLGALITAGSYTVVHTVPEEEREYRATAKLYLDFAADETGEVYQAYNGYTWNDLMATEPILGVTMTYLGDGYTREEVMAATEATILSDLRLLTITVTTNSPDRTDAILKATDQSLVDLGESAKEFLQIRTIQETEAALVVGDSRMVQALLVGGLIGLALSILVLAFAYVLDDRIMTPTDLRAVTDIAFLGYCDIAQDKQNKGKTAEALQEDCGHNEAYLEEKYGRLERFVADNTSMPTQEQFSEFEQAEGILLYLPFGKIHSTYLTLLLEQFSLRECRVLGIAIKEADSRWINTYYGAR